MYKCFLELTYTQFGIGIEDSALAAVIKNVFMAYENEPAHVEHLIEIRREQNNRYCVSYDGHRVKSFCTEAEAVYCMEKIIGDELCACVSDNVCMLHASSVLCNNSVVSFSGASGSGKTSLALLFSKYGKYMGDEYAFLDFQTGELWHERLPFQIKQSNVDLLQRFVLKSRIEVESEIFGRAYYMPLTAVNSIYTERAWRRKLKILIFPHYNQTNTKTCISKFPIMNLPGTILESLMGKDSPAQLLQKFLRTATRNEICFLDIWFSDCEDAAEKLNKYIEKL